jgi:AraC family transcriptional activator of pobA
MEIKAACSKILESRSSFDRLQALAYRDIYINNIGIRVLGIHFMDIAPDWTVKSHRHPFFEFHYVLQYDVYTSIHNTEFKIGEGQFYTMPPGTYHAHWHSNVTGHIGFALRWEFIKPKTVELKSSISPELERSVESFEKASSAPVTDSGTVAKSLLALLDMATRGSDLLQMQLSFCELLMAVSGFYKTAEQTPVNREYLENQTVNMAVQFIEDNCTNDIGAHDIANSVHISYSHLARLFKKHTGRTITYHLNKAKLSRAVRLLKLSDKNLAQIARESGFSNENYFCTVFKKFYGRTPTTAREDNLPLPD